MIGHDEEGHLADPLVPQLQQLLPAVVLHEPHVAGDEHRAHGVGEDRHQGDLLGGDVVLRQGRGGEHGADDELVGVAVHAVHEQGAAQGDGEADLLGQQAAAGPRRRGRKHQGDPGHGDDEPHRGVDGQADEGVAQGVPEGQRADEAGEGEDAEEDLVEGGVAVPARGEEHVHRRPRGDLQDRHEGEPGQEALQVLDVAAGPLVADEMGDGVGGEQEEAGGAGGGGRQDEEGLQAEGAAGGAGEALEEVEDAVGKAHHRQVAQHLVEDQQVAEDGEVGLAEEPGRGHGRGDVDEGAGDARRHHHAHLLRQAPLRGLRHRAIESRRSASWRVVARAS